MGIRKVFTRGEGGENPELKSLFHDEPNISADRLLHSAKVSLEIALFTSHNSFIKYQNDPVLHLFLILS